MSKRRSPTARRMERQMEEESVQEVRRMIDAGIKASETSVVKRYKEVIALNDKEHQRILVVGKDLPDGVPGFVKGVINGRKELVYIFHEGDLKYAWRMLEDAFIHPRATLLYRDSKDPGHDFDLLNGRYKGQEADRSLVSRRDRLLGFIRSECDKRL